MSYFSNIEDGSKLDGLGCGPACNCGPCRSGLNGLGEWYEKEKDEGDEPPHSPAATPVEPPQMRPASTPPSRLQRRNGASAGLGQYGFRGGLGLSGAPWPPMLAARCYGLDLTVPQSYEALEEAVRRWISTCVSSRTEVRPGVPIHRERVLVDGNPSLRGIWDRVLQHLKGRRVRIAAQYTWGTNREEAITFSTKASPPPPSVVPPAPQPAVRPTCPPQTCTPPGTFIPSVHGFKFGNSFSLTYPLPPPLPAITGTYGLCGGMASAALDYYLSCIPIPSTRSVPGPGIPLYSYIFSRLLDSLGRPGFGMVTQFLSWTLRLDVTTSMTMAAARALGPAFVPMVAGLGPVGINLANRVTVDGVQELTLPEFRATVASITSGRMVVLGLVYQGPGAVNIWENHQVLAVGLDSGSGPTTDIKIYDPNHPGKDDVVIRCEVLGSRVRCKQLIANVPTKDNVRGFFRMPYTRRTPPCLP